MLSNVITLLSIIIQFTLNGECEFGLIKLHPPFNRFICWEELGYEALSRSLTSKTKSKAPDAVSVSAESGRQNKNR